MAFIFGHPVSGFTNIADAARAGFSFSGAVTYNASGGRFGGGVLTPNSNDFVNIDFPAATGNIIVQFSAKISAYPATGYSMLRLLNDTATDICAYLFLTTAGGLAIYDATNTVVATTAPGAIVVDTWHAIAIEAEVGSASGIVKVWLDDVLVHDLSGVDLTDGIGTGCDRVRFFLASGQPNWDVCEILVLDTSGGAPWNAYLGDKRLYPLLPTSDQAATWDATGAGSTNADRVDDALSAAADGDTTYVSTAVVESDYYEMEDLPAGVTGIVGVVVAAEVLKTDGGALAGDFVVTMKSGTGTTADSSAITVVTTYQEKQEMFLTEPGGASWTESKVNSARLGVGLV